MSFFGAPPVGQSSVKKVSTLSVQTSAYGVPIPRLWGTARIAPNLLWYGDFAATAEKSSAGGKGGGGSYVSGYSYSASVQFGLCDNPIVGILSTWADKSKGAGVSSSATWSGGALTQTPWAYLSSAHSDAAINYPGVAWIAYSNASLGHSPSLPNLSFEVKAASAVDAAGGDAAPATVVQDILSDVGFPSTTRLGGLSQYVNFTWAYGLFLSPVLEQQRRAADCLSEVLEMTCTAAFWSEGVVKLVPYGDTAKTANGRTFTPAITPAYTLTDDDFLPIEGETLPIRIVRKAPSDHKNSLRIEYKDRSADYATLAVEAQDDAHIAQFGRRPAETKGYDAIKVASVASTVAWLQMQRGLYVLNTYEFKLGVRYCRLEPMDIVTLTHAGLGLVGAPVRILDVEDGPNGVIAITAEDFAQGPGLAPLVPSPPATGYATDVNVAPGNAAAPVIYEPPLLLAGQPEIWLATSGGSNYGGCDVWISTDNATYKRIGTLAGRSRYGTASLAPGVDPDTANTLAVDLTVSGAALSGGTSTDRDLFNTLCVVGGELVSYQTATLTAASRYNLTSLRRGAYGTAITNHASGSAFVRLDDRIFKFACDPALVGKTLYIKLQAYNLYGNAYQDLATLTPITYTVQGYPPPVVVGYAGSVSADGTRVHTWSTAANVPAGTLCEIRYSVSSGTAWADMARLGQAPYGAGRLEVQAPSAGTWTFEARLKDSFGVVSATGARATLTLGAAPYAVTNTNQLVDGAGLGSSAVWSSVTGAGKPADGASADVVLISHGAALNIVGNAVTKSSGANAYDAGFYSRDGYIGGAYVSWVPVVLSTHIVGLNADPAADPGYGSIDYGLLVYGDGNLYAYESGNQQGPALSSYVPGDVLAVTYDGSNVRYLQNGVVLRTVPAVIAGRLFADSSIYSVGATVKNIRFGPMTSNAWGAISGPGKPADNATVGATFGVNIGGQITSGTAGTYIEAGALGTSELANNAATVTFRHAYGITAPTAGHWATTNLVLGVALSQSTSVELNFTGTLGNPSAAIDMVFMPQYQLNNGAWTDLLNAPFALSYQDGASASRIMSFSFADLFTLPAGNVSIRTNVLTQVAGSWTNKTTLRVAVVKK